MNGSISTRQLVTTHADLPIELWNDQPARDAYIGKVMRIDASQVASQRAMTVPDDRQPHNISVIFGKLIERLIDGKPFLDVAECAHDQADVARVTACWWAQ